MLWQVLMIYLKLHEDSVHLDSKAVPKSASPEKYLARCCFSLQQTLALQHLLLHNFSFFFLPSPLLFGSHPLLPLSSPVSCYRSCGMMQFCSWRAQNNAFCYMLFSFLQRFSSTGCAALLLLHRREERGEECGLPAHLGALASHATCFQIL